MAGDVIGGHSETEEAQSCKEGPAYAADLGSIREAHKRIAPYATRTPVLTDSSIDEEAGREVFFKCENLQKGYGAVPRGCLDAGVATVYFVIRGDFHKLIVVQLSNSRH